jgi:hypothetical protein
MAAPETLEDCAARLAEAAGADGRPVLAPDLTSWDIVPFEAEGLLVTSLDPPIPIGSRDANAAFVADRLVATVGGHRA